MPKLKISWIDNSEVVGDLVAVDVPIPRYLITQESQYRTTEILEAGMALVVGGVSVHRKRGSGALV
jgi:hypothetical protein